MSMEPLNCGSSTNLKRRKARKAGGFGVRLKRPGSLKTGKNCGQPVRYCDGYRLTLADVGQALLVGMAAAGVVSYTFYRSFAVFLLLLPIVAIYPYYSRKQLQKKRLKELKLQFKEGILVLSASLSAGYSMENALAAGEKELRMLYGERGMITVEFAYMVQQLRMNRSVEELMLDFGARSGIEEIENFARIFSVAKRSGGQLVPIIRNSVGMIQDKLQVQEEIQTITASKQFEQKIMNMLPFFIIIYIDVTSPGFFDLMYGSWMGRGVMTACLAVYLLAWYLSGKILDIGM